MAKLLIIEDDPYVQRVYKRLFEKQEYEVLLASDGKEGLEKAKREHPNLILLDILMPVMNGLEVLKHLKQDPDTSKIHVIMLSNLGDEDVIDEAKKLGATSFMVKLNFTPDQVLAEVNKEL